MTNRRMFIRQSSLLAAGLASGWKSMGAAPDSYAALKTAYQKLVDVLHIPGLAVGVVQDGRLDFFTGFGYADLQHKAPLTPQHIFPIASLTKTFSAVMLMQAVREGRLSLDAPVLDYPFVKYFQPVQLADPDVRIMHLLSHTSEGIPGDQFVYSPGHYNFLYGVFDRLESQDGFLLSYPKQVQRRILSPLGMDNTLCGYPADKSDPHIPRIVTPQKWDFKNQEFILDPEVAAVHTAYPASGLLTSMEDLVKYTHALDQGTLLPTDSYDRMTAPFISNSGKAMPYGLGWSTTEYGGLPVHWHYGFGDSYSALIIRLPTIKKSLILLANSGLLSAPFHLGMSYLPASPFALAFLKTVLPAVAGTPDFVFDQAIALLLAESYAADNYGTDKTAIGKATRKLVQEAPDQLGRANPALIHLLSLSADPELAAAMEKAIAAWESQGRYHPEPYYNAAGFFEKLGMADHAIAFYKKATDLPGYEQQETVIRSLAGLGTLYAKQGKKDAARKYLWKAVVAAKQSKWSEDYIHSLIQLIQP